MVTQYKGEFIKSKLYMSLIFTWLSWTSSTLTQSPRGPKSGQGGVLDPQPCILAKTL